MADDFLEELGLNSEEDNSEQNNPLQKRISNLSKRNKLTEAERDELAQAKEALEQEKAALEKELSFHSTYADSLAKYPSASEYKDAIKEKVLAGYDMEDAMVAVLAREGKFVGNPVVESAPEIASPVGGSATNSITTESEKSPSDMTQEEKRAQLQEIEDKGELMETLRSTSIR